MISEELDYLLGTIAEEAGEVSQIAGKCLRFGINNFHPQEPGIDNLELLEREYNDIIAVGRLLGLKENPIQIQAKIDKVLQYMEYSLRYKGENHKWNR